MESMTQKEQRDEMRAIINKTAYGDAKPLADLAVKECRWPVGDLFCAGVIAKGSYCDKHHTISKQGKRNVEKYI